METFNVGNQVYVTSSSRAADFEIGDEVMVREITDQDTNNPYYLVRKQDGSTAYMFGDDLSRRDPLQDA